MENLPNPPLVDSPKEICILWDKIVKTFAFFSFQRNCIEFALGAKPVRRYIPKNPIQYKLWAFVTSPVFEYTIFAMILINTLSLAMKFYNQPELYTQFLDVLNVIFTVFFTMEFVFKLGAFRFKVYFVSNILCVCAKNGEYGLFCYISKNNANQM